MGDQLIIEKNVSKDIMSVIQKLKKCHSKSTYDILVADLMLLYNLADKLEIEDVPDVDRYCSKYFGGNESRTINKIINDFDDKVPLYNELVNNYLDLFDDFGINLENVSCMSGALKNKITISDSFDLSREFLSKYNPKLYNICNELLKEQRIIYSPSNKIVEDYGLTFYGLTNFNPYILISDTNTLETSISFVHELGHVYDRELSKNTSNKLRINNQHNSTEEVYSHYLELLFYDFLENKKIFKGDISIIKKIYDVNLCGSFENMYDLLEEYKNDELSDLNTIRTVPEYALGMTLAYHFYHMYLNGNNNIENFLIERKKYDMPEIMEQFGLDSESVVTGKVIEKYLRKNWK